MTEDKSGCSGHPDIEVEANVFSRQASVFQSRLTRWDEGARGSCLDTKHVNTASHTEPPLKPHQLDEDARKGDKTWA